MPFSFHILPPQGLPLQGLPPSTDPATRHQSSSRAQTLARRCRPRTSLTSRGLSSSSPTSLLRATVGPAPPRSGPAPALVLEKVGDLLLLLLQMRHRRIKEAHDLLVLRLLSSDSALRRRLLLLHDGIQPRLHTTAGEHARIRPRPHVIRSSPAYAGAFFPSLCVCDGVPGKHPSSYGGMDCWFIYCLHIHDYRSLFCRLLPQSSSIGIVIKEQRISGVCSGYCTIKILSIWSAIVLMEISALCMSIFLLETFEDHLHDPMEYVLDLMEFIV